MLSFLNNNLLQKVCRFIFHRGSQLIKITLCNISPLPANRRKITVRRRNGKTGSELFSLRRWNIFHSSWLSRSLAKAQSYSARVMRNYDSNFRLNIGNRYIYSRLKFSTRYHQPPTQFPWAIEKDYATRTGHCLLTKKKKIKKIVQDGRTRKIASG